MAPSSSGQSIDDTFAKQLTVVRFVFRYYVDYSAFSALREMKTLIQNQVVQRQDPDNVKLGAGGIRDVEFVVQAFQLIYGGRHPWQGQGLLNAMRELRKELDLLKDETYANLERAYRPGFGEWNTAYGRLTISRPSNYRMMRRKNNLAQTRV